MERLGAGEGQVDLGDVRLEAVGFVGHVDDASVETAVQRGGGPQTAAAAIRDRVLEGLARAPGQAFEVGTAREVVPEAVATTTRGGPETPVLRAQATAPPGHVPMLLTEDPDGFLSWVLPTNHDELVNGAGAASRGATRGTAEIVAEFEVPITAAPSDDRAERGLLSLAAKKVFRVVSAALFDRSLEKGGEQLAKWMERSRHHQVRAFGEKNYLEATFRSLDERELHNLSEGPALLFIHGTNSLSHSDFHLLSREFLQAMSERYDGRVFAFDHPTLSVAPDANARWLAEFLPKGLGLELDIIAHSRGGLVARELAQRGTDNGLDGKLRVRSVTLVGTPNLGTPLCEPEHLGSYVDAMTNLLSVLPDNGITDAVDCVVGVLSHVARKAYEGVPGAMAMNPKGDYLKELNRQSLPSGCDVRIITSDFEPVSGSDWKRHLRDLVVDKVFRGKPNDLIVPTDAEWEQDRVKTRLVLDKSKGIDHSSYWTDDQVLGALERDADKVGAAPRAVAAALQVDRAQPAAATEPEPTTSAAPIRDGDGDATQINVEVVHGSLEHARFPIVVGHHRGAALEGAEGYVDDRLGGRLSRRQLLGLYPEDEGQLLYLPPSATSRPKGVFVVGLGAADEVTATKIMRVVTHAATTRLVAEMEARETGADASEYGEIGLSMVLLGTSQPAGLPVPTCVTAAIDGVVRANKHISSLYATSEHRAVERDSVQITCIEFLERDEDRAEVAARTLLKREASLPPGVVPATGLRAGEGGRSARPATDERSVTWSTLRIGRKKAEGAQPQDSTPAPLQYTLMGGQAGAPVVEHVVDMTLLEPLLADAEKRPDGDAQIQNTLFELLLPHEIKLALSTGGSLNLLLDDDVANYPWEMLVSRDETSGSQRSEPLCVQGGFLRRLETRANPRRRGPGGKAALVIGNPPVRPTGPPLKGACEEARAVAKILLERGYEVTRLIFDVDGQPVVDEPGSDLARDPLASGLTPRDRYWETIVHELFRKEYRIVHIAAHGHFDADDPARSGALISPERFLSSSILGSLPVTPDFVFFNCCHLGQIDDAPRADLAASVAKTVMKDGVRAVVAAGWAVDDRDATTFAKSLYECLCDGVAYGDAVRHARKAIYPDDGPRSSTWGAYQCYGEAGWRLAQRAGRREDSDDVLFEADAERALSDLAAEAGKIASKEDRRAARTRLAARVDGIWGQVLEHDWKSCPLWAGRGRAQAALGDLEGAIASYREVVEWSSGDYAVSVVEQLANCEVRLAQKRFRIAGTATTEVVGYLDEADKRLSALFQLEPTSERLALRGSYYKKRATTLDDKTRIDALRHAYDSYRKAEVASPDPYSSLNRMQLGKLLAETAPEGAPTIEDVERRIGSTEQPRPSVEANYWRRVGPVDALLTRLVQQGELASRSEDLHDAYCTVFSERSTWSERDSTISHLWDLSQLHPDPKEAAALEDLNARLSDTWQGET